MPFARPLNGISRTEAALSPCSSFSSCALSLSSPAYPGKCKIRKNIRIHILNMNLRYAIE